MTEQVSSDSLLPCPFCGGAETLIKQNKYWTGMQSVIISVDVYHWCPRETGIRGSCVTMRGKTQAEAVERWNRRVPL